MKSLSEKYFGFCSKFVKDYEGILSSRNIGILAEFLNNKENIQKFHDKYINDNKPKIVLCGINPGRFGAGLTGVPFIDFKSLSILLQNNSLPQNKEDSSQFIFSVIEEIGIERFFKNVYITNISAVGFYDKSSKYKKNLNYYSLPSEIQMILFDNLLSELEVIRPKIIIPLAKEWVPWDLEKLKKNGLLKFEVDDFLYHPRSKKYAKKEDYVLRLNSLIYKIENEKNPPVASQ